jgi:mannan endo-1,4-beta-mannosidase
MNFIRRGLQSIKVFFVLVLACLLALGPRSSASVEASAAGFHVSGRSLLDANGNNFIMRGVNQMHTWYLDQTSSFRNIKAKGANTVRVVLSSGNVADWTKNSASDVANVINLCKTNKLVCVLEVHDTTGYADPENPPEYQPVSLAQAVAYWKEIKSVLIGQEKYVIINIGNEPYGNPTDTSPWITATKNAIVALRNAGFQHMLMVDAPNWGQDWEFRMRDNAASIFNTDPLHNTVFSIHMYEVFDTRAYIDDYLSSFVNAGLPLVIGEFGFRQGSANADEDSMMALAQKYGIGYLGWAWSGGGYLDMVKNFNPNQETWWGNRIFGGENGICPTSRQASIYGSEPARTCHYKVDPKGAYDGWLLESTEASSQGGSLNKDDVIFNLGDDTSNRQYRAILHFSTAYLPNNAVITNVRLKVKVQSIAGTNPFTTHGGLKVDIRKPYFGTALALVGSDFQAVANRAAVGTIASTPVNGWYGTTLSSTAFPYINLTGATQFRLRFALDDNNDHGADVISFYSGNALPVNRPILIVDYTVP